MVLSGHADQNTMARALVVAHQFLSKPCDIRTLEVMLERTCALGAILGDEKLRMLVGTLSTLPSPPEIYWELSRVLGDETSGASDVAKIIQQDPSLTLKVLQLMNSAYFGVGRAVTSIQEAVSYLGVAMIRAYALGAQVFSLLGQSPFVEEVQRGALVTAHLARSFLKDAKRADEAFTAGLLHDLGKVVLAQTQPEQATVLYRDAASAGRPLCELEFETFGADHAAVGAYVVAMWGLPLGIVEAIAHHRAPNVVGEGQWEVLAAVHVADVLREVSWGGQGEVDLTFLGRIGMADQLPRWRELASERLAAAVPRRVAS